MARLGGRHVGALAGRRLGRFVAHQARHPSRCLGPLRVQARVLHLRVGGGRAIRVQGERMRRAAGAQELPILRSLACDGSVVEYE